MKKLISVFLAVLMVLSLGTVAFAAEAPDLDLIAQSQTGRNVVTAYVSGDDITNGRIEISYDPNEVTLISVTPGDESWITSINTSNEGKVAFAWVGSHINARTAVVTVVFGTKGSNPYTSYIATLTEVYSSGIKLDLPPISMDTIASPGGSSSGGGSGSGGVVTPVHPFTDIAGHWAEQEIIAAWQAAIFAGTGEGTTFSPDMALTRGMLVTLLYRMAGEPAVSGTHPFTDVADGLYYSDATLWAYQNKVVSGTGNGTTFSPDLPVSREQMVTMLYRYAQYTGVMTVLRADISRFPDHTDLSDWAVEAMQWAVADGIIGGTPDGKLAPTAVIDRAQAATILVRYLGL